MTAPAYCPSCGRAQASDARFCASCGQAFDESPASGASPIPATAHQGMAQSALQVQTFMAKVVFGRIVGLLLGGILWWTVVGPALGADVIAQFVAIALLTFGGIYGGQTLVLMMLAPRR